MKQSWRAQWKDDCDITIAKCSNDFDDLLNNNNNNNNADSVDDNCSGGGA